VAAVPNGLGATPLRIIKKPLLPLLITAHLSLFLVHSHSVLTVLSHLSLCHVVWSDCRRGGVFDWIFDLLTTYTHNSELQAVATASLIFFSMALQPFGPWSLFQFLNPLRSR
jgi:hypothetical protein